MSLGKVGKTAVLPLALLFISCSSGIVTVRKAPPGQEAPSTSQKAGVQPQAYTKTLDAPASQAREALLYTLFLMDIPAEKDPDSETMTLHLARTWLLPPEGEVGEFFSEKKRDEDALAWTFDNESLETGKSGNLNRYMKKGGGFTSFMKTGPSAEKIKSVTFEGTLTVKPAGRTRSTMNGEILFSANVPNTVSGANEKDIYKSTGLLEKIIAERTNELLSVQPRIYPGTPEKVKEAAMVWMESHGLVQEFPLGNGFITERVMPPRKGDNAIGNYAKLARQLMPIWIGSYRALFTFTPGEQPNTTGVLIHYMFSAINSNNGKRNWQIYPSKGILEDDFYTHMREATAEFR